MAPTGHSDDRDAGVANALLKKSNRRGHGEGTIFHRGDGRWEARIELGWRDGKRRRKSFLGSTRAEVVAKLKPALADQQAGLPIIPERQTVGEYFTLWLDQIVRPTVRPRTYEGYELIYRLHVKEALEKIRLAQLTIHDVQSLLDRKSASGLAPGTVRHIRTVIRRALNQAMRRDLVKRNVATLVDLPRVERHEITPLTADQANHLLRTVKGDRLEALYVVALALGLRLGEILGLRSSDIDFEARSLRIGQAIQRIGRRGAGTEHGQLRAAEPKTERSRRILVMPKVVITSLRAHRSRQAKARLAEATRWQDTGLVFTNSKGTALEPRNLHRRFKKALMAAGLSEGTRFHDLRHSAASLLLAQGVPLRSIMEILGHSSISVTADVYSHIAPALMQDAAAQMDVIFGNGSARKRRNRRSDVQAPRRAKVVSIGRKQSASNPQRSAITNSRLATSGESG